MTLLSLVSSDTRTCSLCKETKPLAAFPIWKSKGEMCVYSRCRECRNGVYRDPEMNAKKAAYRARPEIRNSPWLRRMNKKHFATRLKKFPEKLKAVRMVREAILTGRLVRPDACEVCLTSPPPHSNGVTSIQAHHDDYSKPLAVRWFCHKCHVKHHLKERDQ